MVPLYDPHTSKELKSVAGWMPRVRGWPAPRISLVVIAVLVGVVDCCRMSIRTSNPSRILK